MAEQIGKEDPEHFKARDEGGMAHPDDDLLLAYTRGQLDKKLELIVQQHMARCQGCRQKCIQYQEDNRKLDILAEIHQDYPTLVPGVFQRIQQVEEAKRRRPVLRLASLPSAVVLVSLFLLFLMAIVVTFGSGAGLPFGSGYPFQPHRGTLTVGTQSTATPTSAPTSVPTPVLSPSPTEPSTTKPYIYLCSTAADLAQWRMRVCGDNFTPGHKLVLFYQSFDEMHRAKHQITVDKQQHFEYVFMISSCRSVPSSLFVLDYSASGGLLATLDNISYDNCPTSTSTPQVAGT